MVTFMRKLLTKEPSLLTREHKQKWLEALRNRQYPQTFNSFKRIDGYDPLGVFIEANRNKDLTEWIRSGDVYILKTLPDGVRIKKQDVGPYEYLHYHGINTSDIHYILKLNDSLRWNFDQIADWIAANIPSEGDKFIFFAKVKFFFRESWENFLHFKKHYPIQYICVVSFLAAYLSVLGLITILVR